MNKDHLVHQDCANVIGTDDISLFGMILCLTVAVGKMIAISTTDLGGQNGECTMNKLCAGDFTPKVGRYRRRRNLLSQQAAEHRNRNSQIAPCLGSERGRGGPTGMKPYLGRLG